MTLDTIKLAQALVRFPSDIRQQDESACAEFLARILTDEGFEVARHDLLPGRASLVAVARGRNPRKAPLGFSGHLDVVPADEEDWVYDPFEARIVGNRLYGRGASDMKSGVAAFVTAAIEVRRAGDLDEDLVLIITAGEETGCEGAYDLVARNAIPQLGALIVAEPTENMPIIGHKGCLRLGITVEGRAAHTGTPEMGDNALEKAVEAIGRIKALPQSTPSSLLGTPTLTISQFNAGTTINIVPDIARFSICARTVPSESNAQVIDRVRACLDPADKLSVILDLACVETAETDAFVQIVRDGIKSVTGTRPDTKGAPYGTDASALTPALGTPPTVILGPGSIAVAHRANEYCDVNQIGQAREIFAAVIRAYGHS